MNYFLPSLAALAAAVVLAACGGGDEGLAQAAVLPAPNAGDEAPGVVRIEGCVAAANGRAPSVVVVATDRDGRLLASALSDADGVFRMHVPAQQRVRLAVAAAEPEATELQTGRSAVTVGACLRATA